MVEDTIKSRRETWGWRPKYIRGYVFSYLQQLFSAAQVERGHRDPDLKHLVYTGEKGSPLSIREEGAIALEDDEEARISIDLEPIEAPKILQADRLYYETDEYDEKRYVNELWFVTGLVVRCLSKSKRNTQDLAFETLLLCRANAVLIEREYGFTKFEALGMGKTQRAGQIIDNATNPNLWLCDVKFNVEVQQTIEVTVPEKEG